MERQIKNNRRLMALLLVFSLLSSCFLINYLVDRVGSSADDEALSHIQENTAQLEYSFTNRINDVWSIMEIEAQTLSEFTNATQNEAARAISVLRSKTETRNVYLISDKGAYIDSNESAGQWQLDETLASLFETGEPVCRLRQEDTGGDLLDFAILLNKPVSENKYSVLLMEYKLDTFLEVLELQSYGGHGVAYVVNEAGETLFKTNGQLEAVRPQNYFFYQFFKDMHFEGNSAITDTESLKAAVNAGQEGAVYVSGDKYSYALSFRPLNIGDWHLMVLVERSAVSGGRFEYMNQIKWISIGSILLVVIICVVVYVVNAKRISKRSEVKLSSRERIINVLSKNSQGIYILIDVNSKNSTFVSESTMDILGIPANSLVGYPVKKLLDCFGNDKLIETLRKWDNESVLDYDRFSFTAKNGRDEYFLRVRLFPPQNGETLMAILDETVDAKREKALEDAVNMAMNANKAKSTFLSNMSHDIRTPMNAIIGFTTLAIANSDDSDKVRDYLSKILSSGNHLISLINDILDMSRIESGKIQLDETEANLSEMLHDIKTIINGQIHAKQLELYMDVIDVTDEDVYCDKTRINQVLLNLLSNAIKFTPAGGTVSVRIAQLHSVHEGKGLYEIRVKDTGIGMNSDFAERIFEPFERERTSTVSKIQGTGLGMAISKNIIDMMGGTIRVHSEKNVGTEFIITLELRLRTVDKTDERIKELEGLKALVVDDDFNTCDSVTKMLVQVGMRSEWTMSGKEAVLRAKQSIELGDAFHAYIIDWRLPDMNGIEVTRQIRRLGDDTPIIILTAYDWSEIEVEARAAGVTAFCSKPMFMSDLRESLLSALGHQQAKEESVLPVSEADDNFKGKRLLLVEDNELNREIAFEILNEYGFSVDTAENGREAVEIIAASKAGDYNLVLMDIQMPVMDGYEATKQIRALENRELSVIPIVAMTANAFDEDRRAAAECGMDGFISKPINMNEVLAALHSVFSKS